MWSLGIWWSTTWYRPADWKETGIAFGVNEDDGKSLHISHVSQVPVLNNDCGSVRD